MSDPKRLVEPESQGTLEERELIEAARARGMPAAAKAAVWSAVVVQSVGAVASAQAAAAVGSAAKGGALAVLWSWKGIVVLAAVGATAATAGRLLYPGGPSSPPPPAQVAPAASRPVASPSRSARSDAPKAAESPTAAEPPPHVAARPPERGRPTRAAPAGTETALPASRLAEEAQSLVEARRLLRTGAVSAALSALEQADREFAGGRLGQEREALLIEALAQAGQGDLARRRAAAFLRNYPSSPHAGDVKRHVEGK